MIWLTSYLYGLCPPALHAGTHGSLAVPQAFGQAVGAPAGEGVCPVVVTVLF